VSIKIVLNKNGFEKKWFAVVAKTVISRRLKLVNLCSKYTRKNTQITVILFLNLIAMNT
jgi:hypothetical protein